MTDMNTNPCPGLSDTLLYVTEAHRTQVDNAGQPYILHVLRVMGNLGVHATEKERIVALLHDVVEDTGATLDTLRKLGYTEEIIQGVDGVTKRSDEINEAGYFRAIGRASENSLSRRTKIADLEDNTLPSRNENPDAKRQKRLDKYRRALVHLQQIELHYLYGKRHTFPVAAE